MINLTEDVKNGSNYCYVRCATLIVRVVGKPWHKTCATHYHAQLGLPEKGCAIKEKVVLEKRRYLALFSYPGLLDVRMSWIGASPVVQLLCVTNILLLLRYLETKLSLFKQMIVYFILYS